MGWYSSSEHHPGAGYPSCSRALTRISRHDTNGYYTELGVPPNSSDAAIRAALRRELRRAHPDGGTPNLNRYYRLTEISAVLTHPDRRSTYDRLPKNQMLIDSRVRAMPADTIAAAVAPIADPAARQHRHWDWFSDHPLPSDQADAQRWYTAILSVAPIFGYRAPIRVLLSDDNTPVWWSTSRTVCIPRTIDPSSASAFALFCVLNMGSVGVG